MSKSFQINKQDSFKIRILAPEKSKELFETIKPFLLESRLSSMHDTLNRINAEIRTAFPNIKNVYYASPIERYSIHIKSIIKKEAYIQLTDNNVIYDIGEIYFVRLLNVQKVQALWKNILDNNPRLLFEYPLRKDDYFD